MTQQKIDVLWIDDNEDIFLPYSNLAGMVGLSLHPFKCWEDAQRELESHFDDFEAIILDAKCKYRRVDDAKADKFLSHVIADIIGICTRRKRKIHWYVLSAGGAEVGDIDNLIHEERRMWDGDWEKESGGRPYYMKTSTEIPRLFSRIKTQVSFSSKTQLKAFLYPDVFNAVEDLRMNHEAVELLEDLLMPIHYPDLSKSSEKHLAYAIRKTLEYMFRALIEEWCILPPALIQKGKVNLAGSSSIIAGRPIAEIKAGSPIGDNIICNNIWGMILATNGSIHTEKKEIEINNTEILTHKIDTNNAHYLFRSYTMQLCDVLIYMDGVVGNNPDRNKNKEKWERIQKS